MSGMPEKNEIVDIYHPNGSHRGTAPRYDAHRHALIHRTVRVWLVHHTTAWFQRRSDSKTLFPGRLDPCATGHIDNGEDPLDAAIREFREETGAVIGPGDLVLAGLAPMPFRRPDGSLDDELAWIYVCSPKDMPVLRPTEETSGYAPVDLDEYRAMLDGNGGCHDAMDFCNPDPIEFSLVYRALERIWAGWTE